jgi:hypothetical protein
MITEPSSGALILFTIGKKGYIKDNVAVDSDVAPFLRMMAEA